MRASTSPPMAFLSECSSMQAMPSPRSTSEAPGLERIDACDAAEIGDAGVAGDGGNGFQLAPWRAGSRLRPSGEYQERLARRRAELATGVADRKAESLHAGDGLCDAGRIPHFKGAQLPVEAGAHGGVDGGGIVGDFADAIGGKVPERGEKWPEKSRGLVFGGVVRQQQAKPLRERGGVFRHFERGQRGFCRGAVLESGEIEDEALVFAVGTTDFLVKALA